MISRAPCSLLLDLGFCVSMFFASIVILGESENAIVTKTVSFTFTDAREVFEIELGVGK